MHTSHQRSAGMNQLVNCFVGAPFETLVPQLVRGRGVGLSFPRGGMRKQFSPHDSDGDACPHSLLNQPSPANPLNPA